MTHDVNVIVSPPVFGELRGRDPAAAGHLQTVWQRRRPVWRRQTPICLHLQASSLRRWNQCEGCYCTDRLQTWDHMRRSWDFNESEQLEIEPSEAAFSFDFLSEKESHFLIFQGSLISIYLSLSISWTHLWTITFKIRGNIISEKQYTVKNEVGKLKCYLKLKLFFWD